MWANRNLWFWLFGVTPWILFMLVETVRQLAGSNYDSGWLFGLFGAVLVTSVVGMIVLFAIERRSARAIRNARATDMDVTRQTTRHPEESPAQRKLYLIQYSVILGVALFGLLFDTSALPALLRNLIMWVLLGVWAVVLWFLLVKE